MYCGLAEEDKRTFARNLVLRRRSYVDFKSGLIEDHKELLIVGDRPGPGSKSLPKDHHNTPFYAKTYCSGWLNSMLVGAGISEEKLLWINSATFEGLPTSYDVLNHGWKHIFLLGNNAEGWFKKSNSSLSFQKFDHPQYHKRFKSKESYLFVPALKSVL